MDARGWTVERWWPDEASMALLPSDRRPYWTYLMINNCPSTKTHSYVGKDRKPKSKVDKHNAGKVRNARARSTRGAIGHWTLNMVVGPFRTRDEAIAVRNEWQADCRGIPSRRKKGSELARKYRVLCFDAEMDKTAV